jgi:hypothetical protein
VRLVIEQGPLAGQIVPLQGEAIVVGRGEASDLRLPETDASRQHARFQPGPQGWMVVDLGSTNGTFVNGHRLPPDQPYLLGPGDSIAIESSVLVVETEESQSAAWADVQQQEISGHRPRPALLVGVVALVVVLVGIVILLVTLLQPGPEPITPTVAGPLDQLATAFPVPTALQGVMTSVAPMLPTGLPFLPSEPEPTPTPQAAQPSREMARGCAISVARVLLPELPVGLERGDVVPQDSLEN